MIDPDKLLALCKNVETLNAVSQSIVELLREAEKSLQVSGAGVEAWIDIPSGRFGYKKTDGTWRLVFTSEEGREPTPIINASRAVRIEALAQLDGLVASLNEGVCALIDKAAKLGARLEPLTPAPEKVDGNR